MVGSKGREGDLLGVKEGLQRALREWYLRHQRGLPWRVERSLYRTVISEFMLQQTQVETVIPYFERWMKRFPDFRALAEAEGEEVLKLWEGLGYYARARNLHRLAKELIGLGDEVPQTAEGWMELPGVGPYTGAAISSIALGYPAAVVDGNVIRVLARLSGDERGFNGNAEGVKAYKGLAEGILDRGNAGVHNEAMMELGATVCTKHNPECLLCPVKEYCWGVKMGLEVGKIPKIKRREAVLVTVKRLWCIREGKVLLHRMKGRRLGEMMELPLIEGVKGLEEEGLELICKKKRGITHHRITEEIYGIEEGEEIKLGEGMEWVGLEEIEGVVMSGPHRRWVRELLGGGDDGRNEKGEK